MTALTVANIQVHQPPLDIVTLFLSGRAPTTLVAYQTDMEDFARFTGTPDSRSAAQSLLSLPAGSANRLVLEYRNHMDARSLSPASVNRRLSTLRSLCKLARMLGLITWRLEVENLKAESYRDTRGPTEPGFKRILNHTEQRSDPKGIRDHAIILLLHDIALRRGEVVSLNLQDVDGYNRTIAVKGKGKREKQAMRLPDRTFQALQAWINARGTQPGPLFTNLHRSPSIAGTRLTTTAVYQIIQRIGLDTHTPVTPHGLRHTAITTAVERASEQGIDLDKVRQFSRHSKLSTLQIYLDHHHDWQGQIADLVTK